MGEGFPHLSDRLSCLREGVAILVSRTLIFVTAEACSSAPLAASSNRRRHAHAPSGEGCDGGGGFPHTYMAKERPGARLIAGGGEIIVSYPSPVFSGGVY